MIDYKSIQRDYEVPVYATSDVVFVKGNGAKLWDSEGNEYIDLAAGISVANIGHCNKQVVDAITLQASTLITCSNNFYNDKKALFLEKLLSITPKNLTRAFLTNSGSEAIEGAIKFARFTSKKKKFIAAVDSFHGRTFGALSATYKKEYKDEFEPLVPGFSFVKFNDFEELETVADDDTAGILLELIQGEGGINIGDKEYFKKVRELCDKKNILLIIDEIQTGCGRTGKMFAIEHFGIEADIITLAKSIAGGFPMGAILCSDKIKIEKSKHGSTFGGNPLACAAGLAAINFMLENKIWDSAAEKGNYFIQELKKHYLSKIKEIRQIGLMIGIELIEKPQKYIAELLTKRIVTLSAGTNVLRLLPPLVISYDEIDKAVEKIVDVLK
ncbi:MAG: aspartate aminotransferase family protein [Ignavibacteriales bacterium]